MFTICRSEEETDEDVSGAGVPACSTWEPPGPRGAPCGAVLTFGAGGGGNLARPGSDVVDDGVLEPGDPEGARGAPSGGAVPGAVRGVPGGREEGEKGAVPYLKCSPSARMVSCCTPPMRLKKMARCPPSTAGRRRHSVRQ